MKPKANIVKMKCYAGGRVLIDICELYKNSKCPRLKNKKEYIPKDEWGKWVCSNNIRDKKCEYVTCCVSDCNNLSDRLKSCIEDWSNWKCVPCEDTAYGQDFINWIENRIDISTHSDTTGTFVLRELVQNADDSDANIIILEFREDALYVYNDGKAFTSSQENGKLGDFDKISRVLAKSKSEEYYYTGNFGSGFQTVYLFTNEPEVHSNTKAFRFNPIDQTKDPIKYLNSPYINNEQKGAIFRLPWRTDKNAVKSKKIGKYTRYFFENANVWKRWNNKAQQALFNDFRVYLHDVMLCCQNLKNIRIIWKDDKTCISYQAERDFKLKYIYNGKGIVKEGWGKGGYQINEWEYIEPDFKSFPKYITHDEDKLPTTFEYLVGSDFVGFEGNLTAIVEDSDRVLKVKEFKFDRDMDYSQYRNFLDSIKARRRCDIYILIPLFPWDKRSKDKKCKNKKTTSWIYSVVPLPLKSGNNFIFTSHLYPTESRNSLENHKEPAKNMWLHIVIKCGVQLYLSTYEKYINYVKSQKEIDDITKQKMFLDYLPSPNISNWLDVKLETEIEEFYELDMFNKIFSQEILLQNGKWHKIFNYSRTGIPYTPIVCWPNDKNKTTERTERYLLEKMGIITYTDEFFEHSRFKTLDSFIEKLKKYTTLKSEKFKKYYNEFCNKSKDSYGNVIYGKTPIDKEFIDNLIIYCTEMDLLNLIEVIPNKSCALCYANKLRMEPNDEFSSLKYIISSKVYPHEDFIEKVQEHIKQINYESRDDVENLLKGIIENKIYIEKESKLINLFYKWLQLSPWNLDELCKNYPIILDHNSKLVFIKDAYWVPSNHYNEIIKFFEMNKIYISLVNLSIFEESLIIDKFKVHMLSYPKLLLEYTKSIEGISSDNKKIQKIIVEGILFGVINGKWADKDDHWTEEELRTLHFLPVNGILKTPTMTCIGYLADTDLNEFFGSIDGHIDSLLENNEKFVGLLIDCGCGDLKNNRTLCLLERINAFANNESKKNKENICYLNEKYHRIVSKCLKILVESSDLAEFGDRYQYRILPVEYRGSIILYTPPRWDWDEKKYLDKKVIYYHSDWPWSKPKEHLNEDANIVWGSIRFLHIHEDFDITNKVIETFDIKSLFTVQGKPRGLCIHFLVPTNIKDSLLDSDKLCKFTGTKLNTIETDKIKKSLLEYVKIYFTPTTTDRGDHKGEKVNPYDSPCIYNTEGIWQAPKTFALNIDEDLKDIGYSQLHSDFLNWDYKILMNIGVVEKAEFARIKDKIIELSNEQRNKTNDKVILKILKLVLEKDIGEDSEWAQISRVKWIPTFNGKWSQPEDVIFPSMEIKRLIGDYQLGSLIDETTILDLWKQPWANIKKDPVSIGFARKCPSFEELLCVWKNCQEKNISPPSGLFNFLNDNLEELAKEIITINKSKLNYYIDSSWKEPKFVVLSDAKNIPQSIRTIFSFENKYEKLLGWLRDETDIKRLNITFEDVFEALYNKQIPNTSKIWEFISSINFDQDWVKLKEKFNNKCIFPYNDNLYQPSKILFIESEVNNFDSLEVLDWLIVSVRMISHDQRAILLSLGSYTQDTLIKSEFGLNDIFIAISKNKLTIDSKLWQIYLILLRNTILNGKLSQDLIIIPILKNNEVSLKIPKEIVIKDKVGRWVLFKDEPRLNIIDTKILPKDIYDCIESELIKCGAKRFSDILYDSKEIAINEREQNQLTIDIKNKLRILKSTVTECFYKNHRSMAEVMVDSLSTVIVYSCDKITRSYTIDMKELDGGEQIHKVGAGEIFFNKSENKIFIENGHDPIDLLAKLLKYDLNPGFIDTYEWAWMRCVDGAFTQSIINEPKDTSEISVNIPDFNANLGILDNWWKQYCKKGNDIDLPILEGDFWWPYLDLGNCNDIKQRRLILKDNLLRSPRLLFHIFSIATLLSSGVHRNQIINYLELLKSKGLSFNEIYDFSDEKIINTMINDTFEITNDGNEEIYPNLRRRIFDILIIKRAMINEGNNILSTLSKLIEDGMSPEDFLSKGQFEGSRPFMKGFKGIFTGQIYFIVREMVRLGMADGWRRFAFHSPTQVLKLIYNIGGPDFPIAGERIRIAGRMVREINEYTDLKEYYDIPFFIYYDKYCIDCKRHGNNTNCKLNCRMEW